MKPIQKLVIVYNADDELFNALTSTMHKVFSPSTYECSLCLYTYNIRGMSLKWKSFLDALGCPLAFYHRTEFRATYPQAGCELPAIFIEDETGLNTLLNADEIQTSGNVDGLILRFLAKMEDE